MGMQQLKSELASMGVFQELTDVMKSMASAKFPKLKRKMDGLRFFGHAVEKNLSIAYQAIAPEDVTQENFIKEIENLKKLNLDVPIDEGLKKYGLEPFFSPPANLGSILIVISSNQGFCGKFNRELTKYAQNVYNQLLKKSSVRVICIGKKAIDGFANIAKLERDDKFIFPDKTEEEKIDLVNKILSEIILEPYLNKKIDEVRVVYNKFFEKSKIEPRTDVRTVDFELLPIKRPQSVAEDFMKRKTIFEPSPLILLSFLIREYLTSLMLQYLLESETAENFLRMNSMNMASEAVKEATAKLESTIRKTRQTTITKELVEIISGAEALKSK
jgi:F-type H+-transporting ATPase subunit gamma